LSNRHVRVGQGRIELDFRAKSGLRHQSVVADAKLARILRRCRDLPGSELFQYRDEDGTLRGIRSEDVNDYLRAISGEDITAKDFRTWAATALALRAILGIAGQKRTKKRAAEIVRRVAVQLTPRRYAANATSIPAS
jgi:DNA topoisomerase I